MNQSKKVQRKKKKNNNNKKTKIKELKLVNESVKDGTRQFESSLKIV